MKQPEKVDETNKQTNAIKQANKQTIKQPDKNYINKLGQAKTKQKINIKINMNKK